MYSRILIPIDLANPEAGARSCPVAKQLAADSGAVINLLSVLPGYSSPMLASFFPEDAQKKMQQKAREDLQALGSKYFDSSPEITVKSGKRAQQIVDFAAEWNADLIVFGCRPKDALGGELMLGSCGITVAERAKCNVLVAR